MTACSVFSGFRWTSWATCASSWSHTRGWRWWAPCPAEGRCCGPSLPAVPTRRPTWRRRWRGSSPW